jgi:hypothetical protein
LKSENHHFGISVEYLQRRPVEETISTYSETFIVFEQLATPSALGVIGDFSKVQHGASFDIGFMHDWSGFRFAWDVKDIFGVVGGEWVMPQLDLGCAYFFPQLEPVAFIRNLIVAFEISHLLKFEEKTEKYEQFAKKLHLGAEIDMHYAALRGGISQGYFTFGAGLAFGGVNLDYAFFTEERGYFAGQWPNKKHVLSLSFGIRIDPPGVKEVKNDDASIMKEPVVSAKDNRAVARNTSEMGEAQ